ncbi:MAG: FKBP-type peptidyl-prolyl cis-trans isomerase [uncultured bacterium]|nr:MAG: FKBP-type peptidyl-prolyl cis-trans isomerase [uncultured bacterium]
MKKRVLIVLIVIAVIVLGYTLSQTKPASAPINKDIDSKKVSQETNKQTQSATNSNNNKAMELKIETTQEGTGERTIKKGDMISVHYTGKLTNGTKFDSSLDRGKPFEFQIGQGMVIQGWEEGFIGAKVGEKRTLTIPAEMGYGSRDMGTIPANSTLIFDVEVMAIK